MAGETLSGLTQMEHRIVLLVARGHTNREISEAVGLTPKTVEWHLSHVYRKLNVRSRTELAIRVVGDGRPPSTGHRDDGNRADTTGGADR